MRQFRILLPALLLFGPILSIGLSSCCEPGTKDSRPVVIDSLFQESYGRDVDLWTKQYYNLPNADTAYYPIYTFGVKNSGSQDDDFTLKVRYLNYYGFDITRHVPAGEVVLFRTPTAIPDSITSQERFAYPNLTQSDSLPPPAFAYFGMFVPSADSTEIHTMRPQVTIDYGGIDNGPEACNTPQVTYQVNIDALPKR